MGMVFGLNKFEEVWVEAMVKTIGCNHRYNLSI
jgi:hypothetical protein